MSEKKKVLILGGGYAGIAAGKALHKRFKNDDSVEITLIDKHPYHTLMTELHEVAGHRTEPEAIRIDLRRVFAGRKVKVVTDEIISADLQNKVLKSKKNEYKYDYIVFATGSASNDYGIDGLAEHTFTLWSYQDAIKIRHHIEDCFIKASATEDEELRKQLLTFIVVGGGFTGVEMAGEIGEAKIHLSEKYDVDPSEVKIYNIEATSRILNTLKKDSQVEAVIRRYRKLGIELKTNAAVIKATADGIQIKDQEFIKSCTVIWGAGIKASTFASSLGLPTARGGRVVVNQYMQTSDPTVFMAGDNTHYEDKDGLLPQIVEAAEQSGHTAGANIANLIQGKPLETHKQNYHGFMVSVGSRYAVSDNNGIRFNGFFAVAIKHMVNFLYLFLVNGVARVYEYITHEFLQVKNNRSFLGGHLSRVASSFWLVPFRIYLGVMWILEGLKKIDEGWLETAKMYASDAVSAASDATASASQAAETAAQYGEPLLKEVPGFMQWIIDNIVAPNAVPFQTVMVLSEIALGACLIVGLFTFLSSIVTVGLTVGITLTGMSDATILWYFFGGIALMAGSGKTFGLDYYVMPFLKKWWKNTKFAMKSYLYFY